jgi:hypothetical protein
MRVKDKLRHFKHDVIAEKCSFGKIIANWAPNFGLGMKRN